MRFASNRSITGSLLLVSLVGCIFVASLARAATSSYTVTLLDYDLVAYCFQTNTLANALPNAPDGTEVLTWNPTSASYTTSVLDAGTWSPNSTLTPGQGFFIWNPEPTNFTYTVQGTPLTVSTYTINFPASTNYYFVGSAFYTNFSGDWLSCQTNCSGHCPYTTTSYGYYPAVGDYVEFWCPGSQSFSAEITFTSVANACETGGGTLYPLDQWIAPSGSGIDLGTYGAPQLLWGSSVNCGGSSQANGSPFRAIVLKPAGGTTSWVQKMPL